jgi:hypothetical protein
MTSTKHMSELSPKENTTASIATTTAGGGGSIVNFSAKKKSHNCFGTMHHLLISQFHVVYIK